MLDISIVEAHILMKSDMGINVLVIVKVENDIEVLL